MSSEEFEDDEETDDGPIVSARNPELARRMETMRQEMDEIQQRAKQADALAKRALDLVNEKDEKIAELEAQIEELRTENEELREGQSLLQHVADAGDLSVDERALTLLQTLYHDASSSQSGKAHMTVRDAWGTLRREIPRSRVYDAVERAEALVDDKELCEYRKEPRGHDPPSRLILNLSDGDLPREINGHPIKRGERR